MQEKPVVEVVSLTKTYGSSMKQMIALDSATFKIYSETRVAVMGLSGSGKSTMLQLVGGLDKPTKGSVSVNGSKIELLNDAQLSMYRNQSVGFIFQSYNLQSHLNAQENAALPLILSGIKPNKANEHALIYLEKLNVAQCAKKFPSQMSGGEMQRVAIARALVKEPSIILADEPTANLDKENAENVLTILLNMQLHKQAIIIVTHDERIASRFDRLIELDHGKVVKDVELKNHQVRNVTG